MKNINNETFENLLDKNGDLQEYKEIYMDGPNEEILREKFLKTPIWDGKTFWQVEKELVWLDW